MYYLNIYKSEKDGSIMLPFNNDIESLIEYVVDQYERMMKRQNTMKKCTAKKWKEKKRFIGKS